MEDTIVVWLDSAMEPFAVNLHATGPCIVDDPMTSMFTTSIQVKHPDGGPAPDTTSYIQKIEREREARERGDVKDNRSFIAKYVSAIFTYYILWSRFSTNWIIFFKLFFSGCTSFWHSCFSSWHQPPIQRREAVAVQDRVVRKIIYNYYIGFKTLLLNKSNSLFIIIIYYCCWNNTRVRVHT